MAKKIILRNKKVLLFLLVVQSLKTTALSTKALQEEKKTFEVLELLIALGRLNLLHVMVVHMLALRCLYTCI